MAEKSVQGSNAVSPRDMNSNRTSLVAQTVKRLSTVWETWVRALGREDPLEEEVATHSSIFAWRIPWIQGHRSLSGYSPRGYKELDKTEAT